MAVSLLFVSRAYTVRSRLQVTGHLFLCNVFSERTLRRQTVVNVARSENLIQRFDNLSDGTLYLRSLDAIIEILTSLIRVTTLTRVQPRCWSRPLIVEARVNYSEGYRVLRMPTPFEHCFQTGVNCFSAIHFLTSWSDTTRETKRTVVSLVEMNARAVDCIFQCSSLRSEI